MPFKKGQSGNPKGKREGTRWKITQIRDDWLKAYKAGGAEKLWKKLQERDIGLFMKLGTTMLPREIQADIQGKIEVSWVGEDNDSVQAS